MMFRHRDDCRLCHSQNLDKVIPLKPIPIITPNAQYVNFEDFKLPDRLSAPIPPVAPLDVYLCCACGHLQLLDIVDPKLQYSNFRYRTSLSLGLADHFAQMAERVIARTRLPAGSLVIEIGSNDGTLLHAFKQKGMRVLGIDPAQIIAMEATMNGVYTLPLFFDYEAAKDIRAKYGQADLIVCANTMANIDNLSDFVLGIKELLKDHGTFVFETQYGADVIRKFLIDTIYHEHLSYFMVAPLRRFLNKFGMNLQTIEHLETKGGSIRGYVVNSPPALPQADSIVYKTITAESERFPTSRCYQEFNSRVVATAVGLADVLKDKQFVVGYGASVGTVTLINQFDLAHKLKFIVDDNPLTECLAGPDYTLQVVNPKGWAVHPIFDEIDAIVVLAWRYSKQILDKYKDRIERSNLDFIVPWPMLTVHSKGKV